MIEFICLKLTLKYYNNTWAVFIIPLYKQITINIHYGFLFKNRTNVLINLKSLSEKNCFLN